MKISTQDEIDAIFCELGLAAEADRKRFQFKFLEEAPLLYPDEQQIFIRVQVNSISQEEGRYAKLA